MYIEIEGEEKEIQEILKKLDLDESKKILITY